MDAGRELDEFVGERVFKLKVERAERWWIEGERDWTDDGELVYMEGVNVRRLPAYSTDIAAAWLVVEKAQSWEEPQFLTFCSELYDHGMAEGWGHCWLLDKPAAEAATLICRAALKAVGA
jgi:hypothetical protein